MGDFWSALLQSVSSLFDLMRQSRRPTLEIGMLGDDLAHLTSENAGALDSPAGPPMWVQAKAQLESLQKADPNFLEATFLTRAAKTFGALLAAEGAMDASQIANRVTPRFLQRFQQQLADWKARGFTRVVSDVNVDSSTTFKVNIAGDMQAITVRFTGSAKRFTRDDMTNLVSEGSAHVESFIEFATFVRPAGSTTPQSAASGGAVHCPSCGAPVPDGALTCTFCGAQLGGSGGNWLLDKISASAYT